MKRYHDCTFDVAQEQAICERYRGGESVYKLAASLSTSYGTIWRVLKAYGVPTSKKTYSYDEEFFAEIDNEAKAYFLGLLTADGYVCSGRRRYIVQLYLADQELVEEFKRAIGSNQPIYEVSPKPHYRMLSPKWMLAVGSKRMVETLARYGVVQAKTQREVFTDLVPRNLIHHYMRGLLDGDGHFGTTVKKNGVVRAYYGLTGSLHVVSGFLNTLREELGIRPQAICRSPGCWKLQCGNQKDVMRIGCFLYRDATIALTRKRRAFEEWSALATLRRAHLPKPLL